MLWATDSSGLTVFSSADLNALMGVAEEEAAGYGWLRRVHEQDRSTVGETLSAACKDEQPFTLRYRLRLADGQFHWVSVGAVPSFGPPARTFLGFLGSLATLCPETSDRSIQAYGRVGEFLPSQPQQRPAPLGLEQLIADALLVARSFADTLGRGQVKHAIDIALYLMASGFEVAGSKNDADRLH